MSVVSFLGLHASSPPSLAVGVSAATYVICIFTAIAGSMHFMAKATRDSGAMRPVTPSSSNANANASTTQLKVFLMKIFPVLAGFAPAALFLVLPFREWALPGWMERFALPDTPALLGKEEWQVLGAGLGVANYALYVWALCVIGRKGVFSQIEARERHKLVDDGPFAYVRHPIYTSILLWPVIMTLSFWNAALLLQYIGLSAFFPKMPLEEALIEDEDVLGAKYTEYKKRVPYRLIPYIW